MSQKETDGDLNKYYHLNIPGVYLPPFKKTIQTFTIDYSFMGINEINVNWSYEVAKALQIENPVKKVRQLKRLKIKYNLKNQFIISLYSKEIPPQIQLFKIETGIKPQIAFKRARMLKQGKSPLQIKNSLERQLDTKKNYSSNDIESFIIYRVLIEQERCSRGWKCFEDNYR